MKTLLKCLVLLAIAGVLAGGLLYKNPQRKAFEQALKSAQQGNIPAQLQVAEAYLTGTIGKPDVPQAVSWYQKAAAQGDARAAYELAQLYLTGDQIERDVPSGVSYLKLAAGKAYAPAQYALGRLYQTGAETVPEHIGQAVWWWLQAAQAGQEDAQAALEMQRTENPDALAAVEPLVEAEKQAAQGDAQAALLMAQAYERGKWLEKDETQALDWYQKAAQKLPQAQYALYQWYSRPESQEEMKALEFLQQAAEGGFAPAQYEVGNRIYQIAQSPDEFKIAAQWFELAAKQNHPGSLYMKGLLQMQGQGVRKNTQAAQASFVQAAELGHADAQYVLGQIYLRGLGQKPSKVQARKWLTLAKENGHAQAAALLATLN